MGKLVYSMNVSLDGFVETPDHSLEWFAVDEEIHRWFGDRAREAAALVPPEQLLVETDAPFLTPHPFRGAPNEPYCLPYTVRALAEVVGRPAEVVAEQSSQTARRVYGL